MWHTPQPAGGVVQVGAVSSVLGDLEGSLGLDYAATGPEREYFERLSPGPARDGEGSRRTMTFSTFARLDENLAVLDSANALTARLEPSVECGWRERPSPRRAVARTTPVPTSHR